MKRKLKQYFSLTVCLMLIITLLVFANGCSREAKIYEDGFYQYIIVGENSNFQDKNNNAIAIVGFTTLGLEQEAIEIPREIDGKPVKHIGFFDEGFYHNKSHHVYCGNLKKLYIHENIKGINYFYGSEVDLMVCSNSFEITFNFANLKNVYVYKSLYDELKGNMSDCKPANIVFMNNNSNEVNGGYYSLDNIETGEKIPLPSNPERNGYEFIGWYTEPECINEWDFDVSPTIKEGAEFKLYAGWRGV